MLIKEYMTPDPITVGEDTSIIDAAELMRKKKIRRFPVLRGKQLVGIVTDRDLRSAAPSQLIKFNDAERELAPELHSLFSRIKVGLIMTRDVVTVAPERTIATASLLMLKQRISGLPVVDSANELVGIITERDIFKVLVDFSGIYAGNTVLAFRLKDHPTAIRDAADAIRAAGGQVASILTSHTSADAGSREVFFRLRDLPLHKVDALAEAIAKDFDLLYTAQDEIETD
jgi:acetoin utilization protein AcuB